MAHKRSLSLIHFGVISEMFLRTWLAFEVKMIVPSMSRFMERPAHCCDASLLYGRQATARNNYHGIMRVIIGHISASTSPTQRCFRRETVVSRLFSWQWHHAAQRLFPSLQKKGGQWPPSHVIRTFNRLEIRRPIDRHPELTSPRLLQTAFEAT